MELASFSRFTDTYLSFLDQLVESVGIVINTIEANSRTEELLKQSQSLTMELQHANEELEEGSQLLAQRHDDVESKNREVEEARTSLGGWCQTRVLKA